MARMADLTKPVAPPDIAHLRGHGVVGLTITCAKCRRTAYCTFDELLLPDSLPIPEVVTSRSFRCERYGCSRPEVLMEYLATGGAGG